MGLFCPKCNKSQDQGLYCGNCGVKLVELQNDKDLIPSKNLTLNANLHVSNLLDSEISDKSINTNDSLHQNVDKVKNENKMAFINNNVLADSNKYSHYQQHQIPSKKEVNNQVENIDNKITYLEEQLKKHPSSENLYFELINAYIKVGKLNRALTTLWAVKALVPNHSKVYELGAEIYKLQNNLQSAINFLHKLVELDSSNIEAQKKLATLLIELGKKKESLEILQKLVTLNNFEPDLYLKIAEVELSLGKSENAYKNLMLFRKYKGESLEMFLLLGKALLAQRFYDGAIKHYKEAIIMFPNNHHLRLGLARAYLGLGNTSEAILELERAFQLCSTDGELILELGKLYHNLGMIEKSDEMFEILKNFEINDASLYLDWARHFIDKNLYDKAFDVIKKALDKSPYNVEIVQTWCFLLEKKSKYNEALSKYEEFLLHSTNALWAIEGIIRCAKKVENYQKLAYGQKKFIEMGNNYADAWCDYAETLIKLKEYELAEKAFEQAIKLDPSCVRAYQAPDLIKKEKMYESAQKYALQAEEAIQKRFYFTAIERLEKALEIIPNERKWIRMLADAYIKIGNLPKAAELLAKIRTVDPVDRWVDFQLAKVYEFEEKESLSIEIYSSLAKNDPKDIQTYLQLLKLKRALTRSDKIEKELIFAIIKSIYAEFSDHSKNNPYAKLLEAYACYIYSAGTQIQNELAQRSIEILLQLQEFQDLSFYVNYGLSLMHRLIGNYKDAVYYLQETIKLSSDIMLILNLARLHENFNHFSNAHKSYVSLKNLLPEVGWYRKKSIEMLELESKESGKDHLTNFINSFQNLSKIERENIWNLYELAIAQHYLALRSQNTNSYHELVKKVYLNFNKAISIANNQPWLYWGLMESQNTFLKGYDRNRALNQNLRICEKLVRENADQVWSHYYYGYCLYSLDDIVQLDNAIAQFTTAYYMQPYFTEPLFKIIEANKKLGKIQRNDLIKYNLLFVEPELFSKYNRL